MKNILIIIGSLRIGGAEKITVELIKHMNRSDKKITFLVFDKKEEFYEKEILRMDCNVVHIKKPAFPYVSYYRNLKKVNQDYGPFDVCHSCTLLNTGVNLAIFSKIGCHKLISHSHSTKSGRKDSINVRIYEKYMKRLIAKYATDFLACGIEAGNYLYGEYLFSKKGIVINNGIDFRIFSFDENKRYLLRKRMCLSNRIIIGNVARLDKLKNQDFLIDVMKVLVKREPRCILLLVGDGKEKQNLEKKISMAGLEKYIRMLGIREDVQDILNIFDVFVLPSLYEGLPLSLVEAQVNGLPVVVSDRVTREIKLSDNCSFLSLDSGVEKWADILLEKAYKSREAASVLNINRKYDIEVCSKELEKVYNS